MFQINKKFFFLFSFSILLRIFLIQHQPVLAFTEYIHDDRHFIDQANFLLNGQWLGPYDQMTLIKGPFYPLWIAFSYLCGVPLLVSQTLLYIFACLILTIAIKPIINKKLYLWIFFTALIYNPMSYDTLVSTRVIREGIYPALSIFVIACGIALFLRREHSFIKNIPWAIGLGFSFSIASLTREETIWFIPPLFLIFLSFWFGKKLLFNHDSFLNIGLWLIAILICILPRSIVCEINYQTYSIFAVTEMEDRDFIAAYSALERIIPNEKYPMIPVTKDARSKIYRMSPAFRELMPFLEGSIGNKWAGYRHTNNNPSNELGGGWFIWALRDSIAAAGYYGSGAYPSNYYHQLANEVNNACATGKLTCINKPNSISPPLTISDINPIIASVKNGIQFTILFQQFSPYPLLHDANDNHGEQLFRDLTFSDLTLDFEESENTTLTPLHFNIKFNDFKMKILNIIGNVYQTFFPFLLGIAYLIFIGFSLKLTKYSDIWFISCIFFISYFVRIGLIAIIDATSFPAITSWYLSPVYPMMIAFANVLIFAAILINHGRIQQILMVGLSKIGLLRR